MGSADWDYTGNETGWSKIASRLEESVGGGGGGDNRPAAPAAPAAPATPASYGSPDTQWGSFGTRNAWAQAFMAEHGRPPNTQDDADYWDSQVFAAALGRAPTVREWRNRYWYGDWGGKGEGGGVSGPQPFTEYLVDAVINAHELPEQIRGGLQAWVAEAEAAQKPDAPQWLRDLAQTAIRVWQTAAGQVKPGQPGTEAGAQEPLQPPEAKMPRKATEPQPPPPPPVLPGGQYGTQASGGAAPAANWNLPNQANWPAAQPYTFNWGQPNQGNWPPTVPPTFGWTQPNQGKQQQQPAQPSAQNPSANSSTILMPPWLRNLPWP